jgi:hypothetical protein
MFSPGIPSLQFLLLARKGTAYSSRFRARLIKNTSKRAFQHLQTCNAPYHFYTKVGSAWQIENRMFRWIATGSPDTKPVEFPIMVRNIGHVAGCWKHSRNNECDVAAIASVVVTKPRSSWSISFKLLMRPIDMAPSQKVERIIV